MSGRLTQWGAGELILSYFSRTTEPPASFWLALIRTTAPTQFLSGSELDEPDEADYARIEIPNNYLNWTNESQPQIVVNGLDVMYVEAVSEWGLIQFWALCNAAVGGFTYFVGELDEPINVLAGDTPMIAAGDLSVSLGPFYLSEEE